MLKKLFLIVVLMLFVTVGLNKAYAEGPVVNDHVTAPTVNSNAAAGTAAGSNPKAAAGTQDSNHSKATGTAADGNNSSSSSTTSNVDPSASSAASNVDPSNSSILPDGNHSSTNQERQKAVNPAYQENTASDYTYQDQTTLPQVTQSQNVHGDPAAQQNQNANADICQQQTSDINASCQNQDASSTDEAVNQKQTTDVQALQSQRVSSVDQAAAEQDQGTNFQSNQSQKVLLPNGDSPSQIQGTGIVTSQIENVMANTQSLIYQGQMTGVLNSQKQLLNTMKPTADEQNQETNIKEIQLQNLNTSDSAKMEQTQTADVNTSKNGSKGLVKVKSTNSLEFIKDTSANMVKLVQEIFVNDVLVGVFKQDYKADHPSNPPQQDFQKEYNWGILKISNSAMFSFNEELQNFNASLSSFLNLIVNGNITDQSGDQNQSGGQGKNNGDSGSSSGTGDASQGGDKSGTPATTNPGTAQTATNNTTANPPAPVTAINDTGAVSKTSVQSSTPKLKAVPIQNEAEQADTNGNQLPNTSTNDYNLLTAGMILLSLGAGLILFRKKLN